MFFRCFPPMFVAYKLQLAKTSNKLTTRRKLKFISKSNPQWKANWNRSWDRSPKLKSKWKSKLTENWNRDRNRDRLLKSRSKSRSTPENETKMEIDFGAKKTFGSRLRVRFLGPLLTAQKFRIWRRKVVTIFKKYHLLHEVAPEIILEVAMHIIMLLRANVQYNHEPEY